MKKINNIKKTLNVGKFKKNKYHRRNIVGEELPDGDKAKINVSLLTLGFLLGLLVFLTGTYVLNFFSALIHSISRSKEGYAGIDFDFGININYLIPSFGLAQSFMIFLVIILGVSYLVYSKLNHESEKNIVYGQKGDSRFSTIQEIKNSYHEIPERKERFEGIGGFPISHYKDKYYIDRDTVNTVGLGASRSGKGETAVVPLIDNLSRAKVQSNIVVNDPKGELYSASKETLEKRGYRVLVLNIDSPLSSMSFNPLQLVIDAWENKDYHEASKRANTLTSMLFASGMGTDNEFFYKSAKSAVNAIILTIVDHCFKEDTIERITMYNVAQMLNELGSLFYSDPKNPNKEINALDEYFNNLPQGNQAKIQYGSTSFAGDKAKGSILSTASQGIEMFTSDLFGKLTSKMSIDLKDIGFPKSIQFKLDPKMVGKRVIISFLRRKEKGLVKINSYRVKVKALGVCVLNFDEKLVDNDVLEIRYEESNLKLRSWYSIEFPTTNQGADTRLITKKFKSGKGFSDLDMDSLVLKYTDQPTAIFMVIPDYDPSNHVICSIFISQLYTELATNCKETPKKRCFRRVHFILDEFGNMPAIDNMDGILTVCLGRNILFNLFLQSYSQLDNRYEKTAKIIKENCQNHVLIMSNDEDTIEEISRKCGHKTIINKSASGKRLDTDSSVTSSADQERIISFERASQLIEGEQVILRNLHRQDNNRNKIRPYPIFNTKETNMPYRYQFLSDEFDTSRDINEIDIECEHIDLSLVENQIPYSSFISDIKTKLSYSIINNIPISDEDYYSYRELNQSQQILDETKLTSLRTSSNNENTESSVKDNKIDTYLFDCQLRAKELQDSMSRVSEEALNGSFKKMIQDNIIDNDITKLLLRHELTKDDILIQEKELKDIILSLEHMCALGEIRVLIKDVLNYKNALSVLWNAVEDVNEIAV